MNCEIPLQLANSRTYLAIFGPCVLVLALVDAASFYGKAPTPLKKLALVAVAIVNVGATGYYLYHAKTARVSIDAGSLVARAGFESVSVPLKYIRWDEAFDASSMRFPLRKNGTSLPSMHTGWFTREGGKDAFLLLSSGPSTLIPTTGGFDLVLPTPVYERARQCAK